MTRKIFSTCLASFAAIATVLAPVSVAAQATAPMGDPLALPSDLTIFGKDDPNVRTATAIVNGHVITGTDVEQRLALLLAASQNEVSAEEMQQLRMQVLRNLIDETLQIQEAKAQEIEVQQPEIDQAFARVAAQNFGDNPDGMNKYLASIGSSVGSLKRQIEGELAWQRLLSRNVVPFVNVSEEEVRDVMKRLEESRGTEEYRLGEIFLSANSENAESVGQNAVRIVEQLRQGGSFLAYARQFSEATTAATGGDLGWIRLPQLRSPQLEEIVRGMEPGQLVGPVEIPGGFWIVYLIDKRQVLMADPRDAVLSLKQISIEFPAGVTQEQATQRVQNFTAGVQTIRGCGDAETAAARIGASVVTNDQIRARSLPDQLQTLVLNLQVGQTTPPFGSVEEGVRVLMLCGRDDPVAQGGPSFDQMMSEIEDERVSKRAQRYLRDLRNDAYIEYN
ncbi:peptidylprolyl isomerase [Altererythrobacter epoxidivorans]|uniref:peptidylprolyl isomerase n=1 Tax=Altererythrobacter epoxidivorans TaxID=361183 RepID=UPI0007859C43|nr:peptidylprolyl isomerase [Altererythrobacter epoxidivorans]